MYVLRTVDFILVFAKNYDGRWRLLKTLKEINHFRFLFDVFDDLQDV